MNTRLFVIDQTGRIQCHLHSSTISFEDQTQVWSKNSVTFQFPDQSHAILLIAEELFTTRESVERLNVLCNNRILIVVLGESAEQSTLSSQVPNPHLYCQFGSFSKALLKLYDLITVQNLLIEELRHERHCFRKMVDSCPDYVFIRDRTNRIVAANSAIANLHELMPADMVGKTYVELTGDVEGGEKAATEDKQILETGETYYKHEDYYQDEAGVAQWNRVTKKRIDNHDGSDHFILGMATNLTEWKKKEAQLQESEARFRRLYRREQLLRSITDSISTTMDTDTLLSRVGEQLKALFDASEGGVLDSKSELLVQYEDKETFHDIAKHLKNTDAQNRNLTVFAGHNDSSTIAALIQSDHDQTKVLYAIRDCSKNAFSSEDAELLGSVANQCLVAITKIGLNYAIEHQAYHDSLTGLPNRFNYERMLEQTIADGANQDKQFSVLFLDLDGFKIINDNYGHLIGDEVLKEIARRLSLVTNLDGFLARMGGDEFSIVFYDTSDQATINSFCEKLLNFIHIDVSVAGHIFKVSASIGVSLYPHDGEELTELMRKADSAMYFAKGSTSQKVAFFNNEIELKEKRRQKLERDLDEALKNEALELYYQPQYELISRKLVGVEALARWNHRELGFIPPDEFIQIAEQSNLIVELGDWVINTAFKQAKQWQDRGYHLKTAINLSPTQCEQSGFGAEFVKKLGEFKLDKGRIEIEVTESTLMKDLETVIEQLHLLRNEGISIAIDDFGTGYSSLEYLQHLPLDVLKIDRSFVNSMKLQNPSSSLIGVIARMAKGLGLSTVVEGVETEAQVLATEKLGCDVAQGWYFAKAMPVNEIDAIIENAVAAKKNHSEKAA